MDENKLTWTERRDIAVESGLQLIPHIGGAISTMYFGVKQEKRLKRIESFYEEFSTEMELMKDTLATTSIHDEDALTALIEKLNDKVEEEIFKEKRKYFKTFLKNSLIEPTNKTNFDQRKYFLDVLGDLSFFDIELLTLLYVERRSAVVGEIKKDGINQAYILGRIGRLKNFGLVNSYQNTMVIGGNAQNALHEAIELNNFGKAFVMFCLLG